MIVSPPHILLGVDMSNNSLLIIEDNQDDFEAVSRALKSVGIDSDIEWYRNGREALSYIESLNKQKDDSDLPHIILLDLNMPGLDGRKILEILKKNKEIRSIPVIIFSTSCDQRDIGHCYDNGANSYIQKPLNYEKLVEVCSSIKDYWFNTAII